MPDRDRLIELMKYKRFLETSELADYLLADGWIRPPCKVWDTVYEIQPTMERIQEYEVTTVKHNGYYWWFTWILKDRKGIYGNVEGFSSHQIGDTVFLTKEEAEAKLKELGK
jgi:hypothetical protein